MRPPRDKHAPIATPAPIPTFAPVERRDVPEEEAGEVAYIPAGPVLVARAEFVPVVA